MRRVRGRVRGGWRYWPAAAKMARTTTTGIALTAWFDALKPALLLSLLAGCAYPELPTCNPAENAAPVSWGVDHGWRTASVLPAEHVNIPHATYPIIFPRLRS